MWHQYAYMNMYVYNIYVYVYNTNYASVISNCRETHQSWVRCYTAIAQSHRCLNSKRYSSPSDAIHGYHVCMHMYAYIHMYVHMGTDTGPFSKAFWGSRETFSCIYPYIHTCFHKFLVPSQLPLSSNSIHVCLLLTRTAKKKAMSIQYLLCAWVFSIYCVHAFATVLEYVYSPCLSYCVNRYIVLRVLLCRRWHMRATIVTCKHHTGVCFLFPLLACTLHSFCVNLRFS